MRSAAPPNGTRPHIRIQREATKKPRPLNQRVPGFETLTAHFNRRHFNGGATICNRRTRAVPDATSADPAGPRAAAVQTFTNQRGAARRTEAFWLAGRTVPRFGHQNQRPITVIIDGVMSDRTTKVSNQEADADRRAELADRPEGRW